MLLYFEAKVYSRLKKLPFHGRSTIIGSFGIDGGNSSENVNFKTNRRFFLNLAVLILILSIKRIVVVRAVTAKK